MRYQIVDGVLTVKSLPADAFVRVINLLGRVVFSRANASGEATCVLPSQGVYVLQVVSGNGTQVSKFYNSK